MNMYIECGKRKDGKKYIDMFPPISLFHKGAQSLW